MRIGVPKENRTGESRVSATPDIAKKLSKLGFELLIERGAGEAAGFPDSQYLSVDRVKIGSREDALASDIVFMLHPPTTTDVTYLKSGSLLISHLEPYRKDDLLQKITHAGVNCVAMELVPRISRAQSMDALSSQAGIAGYRAVLEAALHYKKFFPLMMTSAGSSKPAKLIVLGAGVAGLQAIATAKRLGAHVFAYDIRPEVKEQIQSLGGKFLELNVGEEGSGQGGYAKELSDEAKKKQQQLLTDALKTFDIIVSTANIPGRKSPVLITEEAVLGMKPGSVIIDMAAANGGNCELTEANRVVEKNGVTLVGITNYATLVAADASSFYAKNLLNILELFMDSAEGGPKLKYDLQDEIVTAALVTYEGKLRFQAK